MEKVIHDKKHEIIVRLIVNYEKKIHINDKDLNDEDAELDEDKMIYILH